MQTLFLKRKCITMESLYDIAFDETRELAAEVCTSDENARSDGSIDPYVRSTTLKSLNPDNYPDVCKAILALVPTWASHNKDVTHTVPEDYHIGELQYLRYGTGDHFKRHIDKIARADGGRVFSTSTIISMTEDLQGGDFYIWDNHNGSHKVDLEPGDTLFFDSRSKHEISKVLSGTREVIVAWIYKR